MAGPGARLETPPCDALSSSSTTTPPRTIPRRRRRRHHLLALVAAVAFTASSCLLASTALASSLSSPSSSSSPPRLPELGASSSSSSSSRSSLLEEVLSAPLGSPDLGKGFDAGLGDAQGICRPTGQIHDACCDYETVEKRLNTPRFFETLSELVKTNYFRYYKVDLFRDCPFWVENGLCMNRACTVEKADESEIPEEFRSGRLSSVSPADHSEIIFQPEHHEAPAADSPGSQTCQCRETDFCHWEDEELSSEASWVDLIKNPERFTGYAGPGANRVWKAIYEDNCFGAVPKGSFIEPPRAKSSGGGSGFVKKDQLRGGLSSRGPSLASPQSSSLSSSPVPAFGLGAGGGLGSLMPSLQAPPDPAATEQCLEKRVFYRVISGLHASISTHICAEYLDQKTGEWSPNLECFVSRIAQHPERLQNVYFNYVLLVRALARAGDYLTRFRLKRGHGIPASEQRTLSLLESLVSQANECPPTFDEQSMFRASNPDAEALKTQFRDHFRNISAIMDCVGCDKCRLWGKMQVNGLGTAMKILFSLDEAELSLAAQHGPAERQGPLLERSELVALINTLHRFAESLKAVETFREMYQREVAGPKPPPGAGNSAGASADTAQTDAAKAPPPADAAASVPAPASAPAAAAERVEAGINESGSESEPASTNPASPFPFAFAFPFPFTSSFAPSGARAYFREGARCLARGWERLGAGAGAGAGKRSEL